MSFHPLQPWLPRLALLLCLSLAPLAQAAPAAANSAKREDIAKLLKLTHSERMANQLVELSLQGVRQSLKRCNNCTRQTFDIIEQETRKLFEDSLNSPGGWFDQMVRVYDAHFTAEEIRGLLRFYQSPLGKRLISETPLIAQEGLVAGQQWSQSLGGPLEQRIRSALGKAGLPMPTMAPDAAPAAALPERTKR
ncbi:DUF2059 domain-containing protein [Uliginosibacterium sediminicola]|uniref:DUF2059 domain-containing protein n=1 Tax=Uliginosibacterium sediminicola TaxID=2024550 RepID=A0ABU9YUN1_9RHOO